MISTARLLLLLAAATLFPTTTLANPAPAAAAADKSTTAIACTATSTKGGSFFDLRPDIAVAPGGKKKDGLGGKYKRAPTEDYSVKGYDYGYNFTLNICEAVLKPPEDVVGLETGAYRNMSAYYTTEAGKVFSIG